MNIKERYDLFVEKLKEEGYEYVGEDMQEGCDVYKYTGNMKELADSKVYVWKTRSSTSYWGFIRVKTELVIKDTQHYKASSMKDLIGEIEKLKNV